VDLGAERAHGLDLRHGRVDRHEDLAAQPVRAGGVRERLRVVAGAPGHDARRVVRHGAHLVQRAAQLERAGPLQVLRLQADRAAAALGQARRGQDRRVAHELAGRAPCRLEPLAGELRRHGRGAHHSTATIASTSTRAPSGN
jgi:hypothetical protein